LSGLDQAALLLYRPFPPDHGGKDPQQAIRVVKLALQPPPFQGAAHHRRQ
jgi:hypothetical protein